MVAFFMSLTPAVVITLNGSLTGSEEEKGTR